MSVIILLLSFDITLKWINSIFFTIEKIFLTIKRLLAILVDSFFSFKSFAFLELELGVFDTVVKENIKNA